MLACRTPFLCHLSHSYVFMTKCEWISLNIVTKDNKCWGLVTHSYLLAGLIWNCACMPSLLLWFNSTVGNWISMSCCETTAIINGIPLQRRCPSVQMAAFSVFGVRRYQTLETVGQKTYCSSWLCAVAHHRHVVFFSFHFYSWSKGHLFGQSRTFF